MSALKVSFDLASPQRSGFRAISRAVPAVVRVADDTPESREVIQNGRRITAFSNRKFKLTR